MEAAVKFWGRDACSRRAIHDIFCYEVMIVDGR